MGLFSSKSLMKKMGEQDGFKVLSLAHTMYLMLPKVATNRVIITAHGGHSLTGTNSFTVPTDTILRFYSDDTKSVIDPGFKEFYTKEAAPKEIVSEGERCFDYNLSKYQGRHGAEDETYASIAKLINNEVKQQQALKRDLGKAVEKANDKAQAMLRKALATNKPTAVLTIRNRHLHAGVTLSFAIGQIKAAAPEIILFDCLFCRSTMFGGSDKVTLVSRT